MYFIVTETLLLLLLIETDSANKMQYNAYIEKRIRKRNQLCMARTDWCDPLIRPDAVIRPVSVCSGKCNTQIVNQWANLV